jgi:hypothetical protein
MVSASARRLQFTLIPAQQFLPCSGPAGFSGLCPNNGVCCGRPDGHGECDGTCVARAPRALGSSDINARGAISAAEQPIAVGTAAVSARTPMHVFRRRQAGSTALAGALARVPIPTSSTAGLGRASNPATLSSAAAGLGRSANFAELRILVQTALIRRCLSSVRAQFT